MNCIHQDLPSFSLKQSSKRRLFQTAFILLLFVLFILIFLSTKASATELQVKDIDAQKLWDKSCFTCHGDSGDIARNFLKVVDGELQGPMHKETFRTFLTNHYLSKIKADAVYSMLLTQANAKSRFEEECGSCHQKVHDLVREKLNLNDGMLYSKKLETPTYSFLGPHRNLDEEGIRFFIKELTFIGYEIYQPVKME